MAPERLHRPKRGRSGPCRRRCRSRGGGDGSHAWCDRQARGATRSAREGERRGRNVACQTSVSMLHVENRRRRGRAPPTDKHRHAVIVFLRRVDDHAALTDETYRQGIVMPSSSPCVPRQHHRCHRHSQQTLPCCSAGRCRRAGTRACSSGRACRTSRGPRCGRCLAW